MSTIESLFKSLIAFFVPVHRDGLKFLLKLCECGGGCNYELTSAQIHGYTWLA